MKVTRKDQYTREDVVGRYRLVNHIATSRTCDVWEAIHTVTNKRHAIKLLLSSLRGNKEQTSVLRREHEVGSILKHRSIIRIDEFGIDEGIAFLAMEHFPSRTLKQRSHQPSAELSHQIPRILEQAASSLAYFHSQDWLHRDIKPDNYLVNDEGDVRLIDFSLAKRAGGWLNKLFGSNSKVQGTRTYMSPEQIRREKLDARTDIYSFGCTAFELITGKPPYTGESTGDLFKKHLKSPIPALRTSIGKVAPAFSKLVHTWMAKDREMRPASMDEVLTQIQQTPVFESTPASEQGTP